VEDTQRLTIEVSLCIERTVLASSLVSQEHMKSLCSCILLSVKVRSLSRGMKLGLSTLAHIKRIFKSDTIITCIHLFSHWCRLSIFYAAQSIAMDLLCIKDADTIGRSESLPRTCYLSDNMLADVQLAKSHSSLPSHLSLHRRLLNIRRKASSEKVNDTTKSMSSNGRTDTLTEI
jgi:hypothetical protein